MRFADPLLEQFMTEVRARALSDAEQRPLWAAFRQSPTPRLRQRLYEANLFKVARLVLKAFPGAAPHLDMIQDAALEVLMKAIDKYSPEKGVPIGAYLQRGVVIQASRTYRRLGTVVRFAHTHHEVEVPASVELEAGALAGSIDEETPEALAIEAQLRAEDLEQLQAAEDGMDERERFAWREHAIQGRRLEEVRRDLGLCRNAMQGVWSSALAKVRAHFPELAAGAA